MLDSKQKLRTSLRDAVTSGHSVARDGQVALLTFKSLVKRQNLYLAYLPDSSCSLLGRKKLKGTPSET